jgi:hypothetical protein
MDGTGSRSCPVVGFGISSVEPSGSGAREFETLQVCEVINGLFLSIEMKHTRGKEQCTEWCTRSERNGG